jgi:uncharacterized repeat protein (TIGR01451 family)
MFNQKTLLTFLLFLGFSFIISAQSIIQSVEWQRCIGGSGNNESVTSIINTTDGGYIYVGFAISNDGDLASVIPHSAIHDYWIVKLNSQGSILWQKRIGGTMNDLSCSIVQTTDGGYMVLGTAASKDGDVNCKQKTDDDLWMIKLSSQGEIQWQKCLGGTDYDEAFSLINTNDGGYAVLGHVYSNDGDVSGNHGRGDAWLAKLSSNGTIQWQKCLGGSYNDFLYSIKQTKDGGYILAGYSDSNDGNANASHNNSIDTWILKLSSLGVVQWQKSFGGNDFDCAYSIIQTSDGGYAFAGQTKSEDGDVVGYHRAYGDAWVVKLSPNGSIQWQRCLGGSQEDKGNAIVQTIDGSYLIAGFASSKDGDITMDTMEKYSPNGWLIKLSSQGVLQSQKLISGSYHDEFSSIVPTKDGGYLATGITFSNDFDIYGNHGAGDAWLVKLSPDLKIILGGVQKSTASCQPVQAPQYLENIQVKIEGSGKTYYSITDLTGHFGLIADTGRFNVIAIPPSNLWSTCLPEVISISKPTIRDTTFANAYLFPNTLCPLMEVELTTPFLRRCFESQYIITYANRGTTIQNDAVVELTLDSMLTYVSATRPVRSNAGNKVSFSIGNVDINEVGQFNVTVLVSCESRLGQTHCSSALIPKTMACDSVRDTLPAIVSQCVLGCDSFLFLVKKPNVIQTQNKLYQYKLIADASVIDTGRVVLANDFSLKRKKDERTYRLELRNATNQLVAARSRESTANTPTVSTGFVTQFANAIKLPSLAENCTVNRGAFDPNDKSATPVGIGTNHFIEQGSTIEYLVQFQNTGTDTAFKVVVRDTLSPYFNLSSYKTLATSHPYKWQLNPNGVLTFTFDNIKLVDSFTNEKGSHGFFRYQIRLKDTVATGTKIDNKAAIYFDFNTPIITNIAGHTVGKELLKNCLAKPSVSINTVGCPSKNLVFNAVAKNSGLSPTYAWFKNNETTPLSTNASLTLNNAVNGTKVYCKITASTELCTETPNVLSDTLKITCIISPTEDLSSIQSFDIFPNPNRGKFDVKLSLSKTEQAQIHFLNALGQVLKSERFETNNLVGKYDFSSLPNGLYFIKLTIAGQSIVKKINIQQ